MGAPERHYDVANRVLYMLRDQAIESINPDDIRLEEFPFLQKPSRGISVSMMGESEGTGLNDRDDIVYRVQLTRVLENLHPYDGMEDRSKWRRVVWDLFHRRRIGVCPEEIITRVEPQRILLPQQWNNWNIDASVMQVSCKIREVRS